MEQISRKVQTWSSWNKPKALLFQSEIKQGIDEMRRNLNDCATRFHVSPDNFAHRASVQFFDEDHVADGDFEQPERSALEFGSQPF
jgi:hypothetical protein